MSSLPRSRECNVFISCSRLTFFIGILQIDTLKEFGIFRANLWRLRSCHCWSCLKHTLCLSVGYLRLYSYIYFIPFYLSDGTFAVVHFFVLLLSKLSQSQAANKKEGRFAEYAIEKQILTVNRSTISLQQPYNNKIGLKKYLPTFAS